MHIRRAAVTAGVVALALLGTDVGHAGTDVKVNADLPGTVQNEIRMTRNATDANNLVLAYNDSAGAAASPLGVSFSLDGGLTWTDRQLSVPTHPILGTPDDGIALSWIFDPYVDSDSQGNVYAGYIASVVGPPGPPGGLYIERSVDKGATWSGPTAISFDTRATGPTDPKYRFNDRPDMWVDQNDNVLVTWIKDVGQSAPTGDIYFAMSPPPGTPTAGNPTGLDFTGSSAGSIAPKTINDNPNGVDWANVPDVVVASDGTIYVSWINVNVLNPTMSPASLMLDRSFDGGGTFGNDIVVLPIAALPRNLTTASGATDAFAGSYAVIGTDPTNPQTVYVAYAASGGGMDEADIFFIRSTDGGTSWSAPLLVNDDGTQTDQFHPVMAVKPDGTIDLAWYDKRSRNADDRWDVYLATSRDGGRSFSPNVRISDTSYATPTGSAGQPWMGEYFALLADATNAYVAFTSSIADVFGDVFFDWIPNPVFCGGAAATIIGTAGNDVIAGTPMADVIAAGAGNDVIRSKGGNDILCGELGHDRLVGGPGNDTLIGGAGKDTASFFAAPGPVTVDLRAGTATGWGSDTLLQVEHVMASGYADILQGDGTVNRLRGLAGNDTIRGRRGNDILVGATGDDRLFGASGNDRLEGKLGDDRLIGGPGNDLIRSGFGDDTARGGAGPDDIRGMRGDDTLAGGAGNDRLAGGFGTDTLKGGGGNDTCIAGETNTGCEVIRAL